MKKQLFQTSVFLFLFVLIPAILLSQTCDPVAQINYTIADCNQTTTFQFSTTNPSPTATPQKITWRWNNELEQEVTSPPFVVEFKDYELPGNYEVQAIVEYTNGCMQTINETLSLYSIPQTRITGNGNPGWLNPEAPDIFMNCEEEYDFEGQLQRISPNTNYTVRWDDNEPHIPFNDGTFRHLYDGGLYYLTITGDSLGICVDSTTYRIICEIEPTAQLFSEPVTGDCKPYPIELELVPDYYPYATYEIKWLDGDITTLNGLTTNKLLQHTYNIASEGIHAVFFDDTICHHCFRPYVKVTNPCPSPGYAQVNVNYYVYDKPYARIHLHDSIAYDEQRKSYYTCEGGEFEFVNKSRSGFGPLGSGKLGYADTIRWLLGDKEGNRLDSALMVCKKDSCSDKNLKIELLDKSEYRVYLTQTNFCGSDMDSLHLELGNPPEITFDIPEQQFCYPANINFENQSSDGLVFFRWDFGDGVQDSLNYHAEHTFFNKGEYKITLFGRDNYCDSQFDTTIYLTEPCENIRIPTAFIPNSNNEIFRTFRPVGDSLISYQMRIFNIWGQMLWESSELLNGKPRYGWDGTYNGKPCPPGTYIWRIEAVINDGTPGGRKWDGYGQESGTVGRFTLIR